MKHSFTMKKQNPLFPTTNTNFVNPDTGELTIKYRPGYPRSYRFDASRGQFVRLVIL